MQETQVPSPIWEDPLEKEMATPLQYSCPGNPMDRGGWRATAHEVAGVRHNLATRAVVRKFGHPLFGGERGCPAVAVSTPHGVARVESGVWAGHEEAVRKGGVGPLKAAHLGRKVGAEHRALTACVAASAPARGLAPGQCPVQVSKL